MLQSLFTWIFYLFKKIDFRLYSCRQCFNPYSPGFSIYLNTTTIIVQPIICFNPYSPGFSIYFNHSVAFQWGFDSFNPYSPGFSIYFFLQHEGNIKERKLQSLFTWIFYLFELSENRNRYIRVASILIHLDFLSI